MANKFKIDKQTILATLKKRWWVMLIEFLLVGVILALDLVSKEYVCKFLESQPGLYHDLIPKFIELQYTSNTGAGFGIFADNTVALTVVTIIVVVGIMGFLMVAQKQPEWLRISLIFVCAGGIGNVVDRIGLGYVRDFIRFAFWENFAIFNVADVFVTVGAFMLIIVLIVMLIQEGRKSRQEFAKEQAEKGEEQYVPQIDPYEQPVNEFLPNENQVSDFKEEDLTDNPQNDVKEDAAQTPDDKDELNK